LTHSIAKCFALAPTTQAKSKKQRVVVVTRTPRTCLPSGEAAAVLEDIIAKQLMRERKGAALAGGKGAAGEKKRTSGKGR
jgi:hypothetical protein